MFFSFKKKYLSSIKPFDFLVLKIELNFTFSEWGTSVQILILTKEGAVVQTCEWKKGKIAWKKRKEKSGGKKNEGKLVKRKGRGSRWAAQPRATQGPGPANNGWRLSRAAGPACWHTLTWTDNKVSHNQIASAESDYIYIYISPSLLSLCLSNTSSFPPCLGR